jgi:hypothetical protein
MATLNVSWILPTTRESGKPLAVSEIADVEVFISADLGLHYTSLNKFPPTVLNTRTQELEPGEWRFRGIVHDKNGRVSKPVDRTFVVADTTNPSALTDLVLTL